MAADQPTQRDLFEHRPAWAEDDLRVGTIATVVLPDGVDKPLDYLVPEQLAATVVPNLAEIRVPIVPNASQTEVDAYFLAAAKRPFRDQIIRNQWFPPGWHRS